MQAPAWKDGVVVPHVSAVRWLGGNAFAADFHPHAQTSSVIFDLSASSILMSSAPHLAQTIGVVLQNIMSKQTKIGLLQECFSRHPVEAHGDVVYGEDYKGSLQVDLLRVGVSRVTRPHPDAPRLFHAEQFALTYPQTFAARIAAVERSPHFLRQASGMVVDVVQANWLRVFIQADGHATARAATDGGLTSKTILVELASIECPDPKTDSGYRALRLTQEHLLFARVHLLIHSVVPCDKDVANNTQLVDYWQLAHVRATVIVLSSDATTTTRCSQQSTDGNEEGGAVSTGGGAYPLNRWERSLIATPLQEGEKSALQRRDVESVLESCSGDWARLLVHFRFAKLQIQPAFTAPRSANYVSLVLDCSRYHEEDCRAAVVAGTTPVHTILNFWRRWLADSDVLEVKHDRHLTTHSWLPIKFMWPYDFLVERKMKLRGHVHSLQSIHDPAVSFSGYRFQICVGISRCIVQEENERLLRDKRGSIAISPAGCSPTLWTNPQSGGDVNPALCYGNLIKVRADYLPPPGCGGLAELRNFQLLHGVTYYDVTTFDPTTHKPNCEASPATAEGSPCLAPVELTLRLPQGVSCGLFVVDLELRDSDVSKNLASFSPLLRRRHIYVLHQHGTLVKELEATMDADEEEAVTVQEKEDESFMVPSGSSNVFVTSGSKLVPTTPTSSGAAVSSSGDAGGGATTKKSLQASENPSAEEIFHAIVDVYAPVHPSQTHDGQFATSKATMRLMQRMLFKDVELTFVGLCTVKGRRGYYGHIKSLCDDGGVLEATLATSLCPAHVTKVAAHAQPQQSTTASSEDASTTTQSQLPVDGRKDVHTDEVQKQDHIWSDSFGRLPLIKAADSQAPLPSYPSVKEWNSIPLLSFALQPRQLFASHPKHHRNIIAENDKAAARGYAHIDAAFMRLSFPRLPSIFRGNMEWMPLTLHAVEEHILAAEQEEDVGPHTVCIERPMAALMAAIFMITPTSPKSLRQFLSRHHITEQVQANYTLKITEFRSSAMLFFKAAKKSTSPEGTSSVASKTLVLGTKSSFVDRMMRDSLVLPRRLPATMVHRMVSTLGLEAAVRSADGHGGRSAGKPFDRIVPSDDADRIMGSGGFGSQGPLNRVPYWMYCPPPGDMAVIGEPLLCKQEPSNLASPSSPSGEGGSSTTFSMQYIPIRVSSQHSPVSNMYKLTSYGQVGRDVIFSHQVEQTRRGRDLVEYMSLLLRQRQGQFPDGLLKVYGNAHEPLYLSYMARETLRFQLSLRWDAFRSNPVDSSDATQQHDAEERELLMKLSVLIKRMLWDIAAAVGGKAAFLKVTSNLGNEDTTTSGGGVEDVDESRGLCVIHVYPIEETDAAEGDGLSVEDKDEEDGDPRSFHMYGNVLGRMAAWQVRIRWVGKVGPMWDYEIVKLRDCGDSQQERDSGGTTEGDVSPTVTP